MAALLLAQLACLVVVVVWTSGGGPGSDGPWPGDPRSGAALVVWLFALLVLLSGITVGSRVAGLRDPGLPLLIWLVGPVVAALTTPDLFPKPSPLALLTMAGQLVCQVLVLALRLRVDMRTPGLRLVAERARQGRWEAPDRLKHFLEEDQGKHHVPPSALLLVSAGTARSELRIATTYGALLEELWPRVRLVADPRFNAGCPGWSSARNQPGWWQPVPRAPSSCWRPWATGRSRRPALC